MKKVILTIMAVVLLIPSVSIWAENDNGSGMSGTDEESMFGGDAGSVVEEVKKEDTVAGTEKALLKSAGATIGGKYIFSVTSSWNWVNPELTADSLKNPEDESLDTALDATIYLDSKPSENFRVFGKVDVSYPFTEADISVRELFSDFNWNNRLFFRGGKQTINWGVGYFFSPADLVNLTPINPEDPEAEREGPVSLKVNLPLDIHNLYLYLIDNNIEKPWEVAVAPKAEFVLGETEVGIGGIYQYDHPTAGMLTFSSSISDFDIFGEGVMKYGSDKNFIETTDVTLSNPLGLQAVKKDDTLFFSGTVGFMYNHIDEEGNFSFMTAAQYLYNGEGYADKDFMKDNNSGIMVLLGNGDISASDLLRPGLHYGAASFHWNGMFNSDFSLSLFWIGNLMDGSGRVSPSVSYSPIDNGSITVSLPFTYGDDGYEYTQNGRNLSLNVKLSLGSGSF